MAKKSKKIVGTKNKKAKPAKLADVRASDFKDATKAPHFDLQEKDSETNVDVEIAKGSISDFSQTDSRPKGSS